jgi:hypothetical protein
MDSAHVSVHIDFEWFQSVIIRLIMNFQALFKFLKAAIQRNKYNLLISLFGCFLIGAAWSNVLVHLKIEYEQEIERINSDNNGLARAFEEHVRRVVESADEMLLFLKMQYEKHGSVGER